MKRTLCMTAAAVLLSAGVAGAQTTLGSQNVTATAFVGNQARLTVTGTVTFPDSDPDTVPSIPATGPVSVAARARVAPSTQLDVTVRAGSSFFDPGTDSIPATALSWTASGAPFVGGSMATTDQSVATWTGPANQTGDQNYSLTNAWTYVPGTYNLTLIYTLSTP